MIKWLIALGGCCGLFAGEVDDIEKLISEGQYKQAIERAQEVQCPNNKILLSLSRAYLKDQDREKAIQTFLEALKSAEHSEEEYSLSDEERALYDEALAVYVGGVNRKTSDIAKELRERYSNIVDQHEDYYMLNFLLAVASANLNDFDDFFDRFYRSYVVFPESYMAYKTQGILYLMLWERAKTPSERQYYRHYVMDNLRQALSKNDQDITLYKLLIVMSDDKDKKQALNTYLTMLLNINLMIPRLDVYYYVSEAVDCKEHDLARQVIDKAGEWYEYSRAVVEAEQILKQAEEEHIE